jgi:hypothetical protein
MPTSIPPAQTTRSAASTETAIQASSDRKPLSWQDFAAARQLAAQHAQIASQLATPVASSAQVVFATWELCDIILKNLSCADIERVRGVNSTCNAVAKRSLSLQQNRYIKPRSIDSARITFASPTFTQLLIGLDVSSYELIVIELHQILKVKGVAYSRFSWSIHGGPVSRLLAKEGLGIEIRDINRLAAISRHASLNGMFLSQPPVHNMRITIEGHVKRKHRFRPLKCVEVVVLNNERGITFGEVFDKVGQSIRLHHNARVGLMTIERKRLKRIGGAKCLGHSTRTICTNNRRYLVGELLVGVALVGANGERS